MAQGDTKGDIVSISAGGTSDIQPPSGEHWTIYATIPGNNNIHAEAYDGTTAVKVNGRHIDGGSSSQNGTHIGWGGAYDGTNDIQTAQRVPINNSQRVRFNNTDACNSGDAAYRAIQHK